jgi:hypothetical protein
VVGGSLDLQTVRRNRQIAPTHRDAGPLEAWIIRPRAGERFLDRPVSIRESQESSTVPALARRENRLPPLGEYLGTIKCSPGDARNGSRALDLIKNLSFKVDDITPHDPVRMPETQGAACPTL